MAPHTDPIRQKVITLSRLLERIEVLEALGDEFEVVSGELIVKKPGGILARVSLGDGETRASLRLMVITERNRVKDQFDELTGRKKHAE